MKLADTIPTPEWVDSSASLIRGLDLLGLRLPVQTLGGFLLDGVTTVTVSVRYLSILCWSVHTYGNARRPDSWEIFHEFAARVEAAVALGNILVDASVVGVIGSTKARELATSSTTMIPLDRLVEQLATNVYSNPCEQLGLTLAREGPVVAITKERGLVLARILGERIAQTSFGRQLEDGEVPNSVSRTDLIEFGEAVRVNWIPEAESAALVNAIIPTEPRLGERSRVQTYACLLALADRIGKIPTENDLFAEAESLNRRLPNEFGQILDGWLRYRIRDLIAYVHELTLKEIVATLNEESQRVKGSVEAEQVLGILLAKRDDHAEALVDLGLLERGEDPGSLGFAEFRRRCLNRFGPPVRIRGLNRSQGSLRESKLIRFAETAGAGALALVPAAWILAAWRSDPWIEYSSDPFEQTAVGHSRMGLFEVIRPTLRRYVEENWSLVDVVTDLAFRTAEQHLDIAWSRMATDAKRDVGVFLADGRIWHSRDIEFYADRTASRISQATSWLTQLDLLDPSHGMTASGREVLERSLAAIRLWEAE